jgi:hypothetical protein
MKLLSLALAFLTAILIAGCGPSTFRKEITETRTVAPSPAAPAPAPAAAEQDAPFAWQLPEGWQQAPPRPMRLATFKVAGNADIDCYLTSLSGKAGGIDANVNRWRDQLGLPPATPDELAKLPQIDMLGQKATLVEAAGSFEGMDGQKQPGWMLVGAILNLNGQMLFAKMTGPEQAVRAEKDRFVSFCKSLQVPQ